MDIEQNGKAGWAGILCLILLLASLSVWAEERVRIGVLAFRPKPQTLAQWQPLGAALARRLPGRHFEIEAYTYPELDQAVAEKRIDFILTNPGHYVLVAHRLGLTAPLATLAADNQGRARTMFGGVIFTRTENNALRTLADLKGRTLAATSTDSLGGYQMQAYELSLAGVRLPQDGRLLLTGMPHDKVVEAVLEGRADAGFVRTGVLEQMAREGRLDLARLRVLNPQHPPDFPQLVSTRLYPEWPFAALPGTDENLARHVAAALFMLEEDREAVHAIGIHGFVVPADYTPVADLLKELRLPPFDQAPRFQLEDVWARYRWPLLLALAMFTIILVLAARLLLARRKLEQQQQALRESEARLRAIIQNEPECIKIVDGEGRLCQMNPAGLAMVEADSAEQVIGRPVRDLIAPEYRAAFDAMHQRVLAGEPAQLEYEVQGLKGGRRWLETHAVPMEDHGRRVHLAVTRDITRRKLMEEQVRQLAFYDALTGLPNRRLLEDRLSLALSAARRSGKGGALLFLDLDNFKPLNDRYGHEAGDRLLIQAAQRLGAVVRESDTVARLGGDEFVVVLGGLNEDPGRAAAEAQAVAEKIRDALSQPYALHLPGADSAIAHVCTVSVGVAMFDRTSRSKELLRLADMAMYDAKHQGRNRIVLVTEDAPADAAPPAG